MRVLATMPGRFGDILWALPTVRALREAYGGPIDFLTSIKYGNLLPLLQRQPYIGQARALCEWAVQETAPMTPREPPMEILQGEYDAVYHLGYEGWPQPTLAEDIWRRATQQYERVQEAHPLRLDLTRPWITPPAITTVEPRRVWVAWSEEWFELKVGILACLSQRFPALEFWWLRPEGGRYGEVDRLVEGIWTEPYHNLRPHALGGNVAMMRCGWAEAASLGASCQVYLGCLSSQWVLANGLGIRCVVVEPNSQRHHPVFWSDGGGRNRLVRGNDGLPTHDARHTGDVLEEVLR